tara:strand:- start:54 stop:209 length:156 start_codon:yes stop_codon:yes gene_type:complete
MTDRLILMTTKALQANLDAEEKTPQNTTACPEDKPNAPKLSVLLASKNIKD